MKVRLIFVPPGGGEADYQLEFELPAVPQPGDYINVRRGDGSKEIGYETFTVRRTMWELDYPETASSSAKKGEHGTVNTIWVECEFARSGLATKSHNDACARYAERGYNVQQHEATAY